MTASAPTCCQDAAAWLRVTEALIISGNATMASTSTRANDGKTVPGGVRVARARPTNATTACGSRERRLDDPRDDQCHRPGVQPGADPQAEPGRGGGGHRGLHHPGRAAVREPQQLHDLPAGLQVELAVP